MLSIHAAAPIAGSPSLLPPTRTLPTAPSSRGEADRNARAFPRGAADLVMRSGKVDERLGPPPPTSETRWWEGLGRRKFQRDNDDKPRASKRGHYAPFCKRRASVRNP